MIRLVFSGAAQAPSPGQLISDGMLARAYVFVVLIQVQTKTPPRVLVKSFSEEDGLTFDSTAKDSFIKKNA